MRIFDNVENAKNRLDESGFLLRFVITPPFDLFFALTILAFFVYIHWQQYGKRIISTT